MAISGSFNTSAYDGRYYKFSWTATQSIANNESTVSWKLEALGGNEGGWYAERTLQVVIDGDTVFTKEDRVTRYAGTVATGSKTIKHDAQGLKSFSASVKAAVYVTNINCTGKGTWDIKQIPRQATLTAAPNFTDVENPKINYSNPAGTNVTSLQACISLTGMVPDIPYRDISKTGTEYIFNLTEAEKSILRNATSGSNSRAVTFYVRTIIDGQTFYSSLRKTFTITNGAPILKPTAIDVNATTVALTGDNNKFVKFYSNVQFDSGATAQKAATIKSQRVTCGTNAANQGTGTFNGVESGSLTFTASDSRGNTTTQTINKTLIEYVKLTCNASVENPDTSGTMKLYIDGRYWDGHFGAVDNGLTVQYRIKPSGGSYGSWITIWAALPGGHTYTCDETITGLDYTRAYTIQARAYDAISTVTSAEMVVRSTPVFDWSAEDFKFNVPVVFAAGATGVDLGSATSDTGVDLSNGGTINGDLTVTGNLRLKGAGNYGNTLYFGDGSYANISEPSDDTLTIKATNINLNGNVSVNGSAIGSGSSGTSATAGTWTPSLNSSAVSSYTVRQGWYQKVGNIVTIGFQIKATINSGYSSTALSITGAPFTPAYMAAGGGIAHNINITAGHNFEAWVISDTGAISARTQPCNGTAAGNLQIGSSTYYPTGTGTLVTLAGTICYTV